MQDLQMERSAEDWLKALVEEDRAPVFARSDQPDGKVIRQLERAGAVIRLPGDVIVLRRPADNRDEVLRRVYWPIVEALLSNYSPAVIERDSAVRILVADETPPPLLRLRNGRNASNFEVQLTEGLQIAVDAGAVEPSTIRPHKVADAQIALDDPARILFGLELRFVRDNLALISLWIRSLVIPKAAVEAAYDEYPRPVVLRRIAHLAEDVGNTRLAEMLNDVIRAKQNVRIGRAQTGVGRELVIPVQVSAFETTRRPWLDRLLLHMEVFGEQIAAVTAPVEAKAARRSIESLLSLARAAKTDDVYHSTSLEGYRIRYEDVSVLLGGAPAGGSSEEEIRNRMAVVGYGHAFDNLLERLERARGDVLISDTLVLDLYVDLFQPSVEAGIVEPDLLRGWRTSPVFIRNTRYVPPAADHLGELMAGFLNRLDKEGQAIAKSILAHLMLVTIHPFPDGNGRVARFLMNAVLLGGGLPWVTIEEGDRREYFDVLKTAQLNENAGPFAEFILLRAIRALEHFGSSEGVS